MFTIYIVPIAGECKYIEKWFALFIKLFMFMLSYFVFSDGLTMGVDEMVSSIVITCIYCANFPLNDVYKCNVTLSSVCTTFMLSSISYMLLRRFRSYLRRTTVVRN